MGPTPESAGITCNRDSTIYATETPLSKGCEPYWIGAFLDESQIGGELCPRKPDSSEIHPTSRRDRTYPQNKFSVTQDGPMGWRGDHVTPFQSRCFSLLIRISLRHTTTKLGCFCKKFLKNLTSIANWLRSIERLKLSQVWFARIRMTLNIEGEHISNVRHPSCLRQLGYTTKCTVTVVQMVCCRKQIPVVRQCNLS